MRFLTWNIGKGGGKRISQIINEIDLQAPDFVTLTEVTNTNLSSLRRSLTTSGLVHIETTCRPGGPHSVFVASKVPFEMMDDSNPSDPERWLPVRIESLNLNVLCVHIPGATDHILGKDGKGDVHGKRRKQNFWDEVIRYAQLHKDERTILTGDFNTGLKEDAQGTPFELSDNIRILRLEKYTDTWRHLNPKTREYTFYSQQKGADYNGFRLDYVYVSAALRDSIVKTEHVHSVRVNKLSDHSMVVSDLSV
ncbi:endonuclease/exonuclease/phosphatase family protein [Mycolicibacterium peregrinum]|uniref:Endonuclease/exonuclease/phosphatase domain-containing protein n=1 Tax=Mycolicibacterium peregrinum TaxID=43304 RepID=A0A1A0W3K5_MYCPR|nr:endonuclease/exonuclease/phosphatase family protein [Mycolicibacterium peregrinum]OBB90318.1 hypothetical protein A5779_26270 [Mycolicibacterium peregrinum]